MDWLMVLLTGKASFEAYVFLFMAALVVWMVVDAVRMGRGMPPPSALVQEKGRRQYERDLKEHIIHSDWVGNRWHSLND